MRGYDTQQSAMFSYLSPEQRVPADHPLRRIRALTDQVFKQPGLVGNTIWRALRAASDRSCDG